MGFVTDLLEQFAAYLFSRAVFILGLVVLVVTAPWWVPLVAPLFQLQVP